jgi:hypothetical protein
MSIQIGNKLPIGVDSFRSLILDGFTFIDKSLFIHDFDESPDKVTLILRPRRFGKSMNLDMLRYLLLAHCRYFFEKVPVETPDTCNRRDLFNGLLIETNHPVLFESHFGKYPAIYLSLKVHSMPLL